MAVKWVSSKKFPGVRWYEHETRRHGVTKDRYFAIRYQQAGKRQEEGLGWASAGMTEKKAALTLESLKEAARTGEGHARLSEKRAAAEAVRQAEEAAKIEEARAALTFADFWHDAYLPQAEADKKPATMVSERALYARWIEPAIGRKPMAKVAALDLERMKKAMADAGKAPRTIKYALDVVRQVYVLAKDREAFAGDPPTAKVKTPREDNRRQRFLTREEAGTLLKALAERSRQAHDMALLSLECGLRFGEIAGLTWADVDLERGTLSLRDTKSGRNRCAYLTAKAAAMLAAMVRGKPDDLLFPARGGGRMASMSDTFARVAAAIGLNDGYSDRRQHVVFHTLRHTFASRLVENGVDLYSVKTLLGHSCIDMTERYSHLAPDALRRAVRTLEEPEPAKVTPIRKGGTA